MINVICDQIMSESVSQSRNIFLFLHIFRIEIIVTKRFDADF